MSRRRNPNRSARAAPPLPLPKPPPRVRAPAVPARPVAPRPGRFVWTCRSGFEAHLYEELAWAGARPSLLGPALVDAQPMAELRPAFGRAGFWALAVMEGARTPADSIRAAEILRRYA